MGSNEAEKKRRMMKCPQRTFSISAFWMGAYEVTYDEFDVFFKDMNICRKFKSGCGDKAQPQYIDLSLGYGKEGGFPATVCQQYTALMYCRWLYKKTGIFFRLPQKPNGNMPAVQVQYHVYPFGNDAATTCLNMPGMLTTVIINIIK